MRTRRVLFWSGLLIAVGGVNAHAADVPMCVASKAVPVERQLRQLTLDLLGRPPTLDEYRAVQGKTTVSAETIRGLMGQETFYARMREYHRALLRSNVRSSVNADNVPLVAETIDGAKPYEMRVLGSPRGGQSQGCDHFIPQDECDKAPRQDPHAEPVKKICRDYYGTPLPVSFDYDLNYYQCDRLNATDASITDCTTAVAKGALPDKLIYFCDMRRDARGVLQPFKCLPDPKKSGTLGLVDEVLEPGTGRVVTFVNPKPLAGAQGSLDRCGLSLKGGGTNGMYGSSAQRGCVQRDGWVMTTPPYWDSTGRTEVAACAYDAQERAVNPGTLESCERGGFASDRTCGCGPRFRRCDTSDGKVFNARVAAVNEEPLMLADSIIRRDENYFNMLTTRRSFVNGPMSEMYRASQKVGNAVISAPVDMLALPAMPFTADATQWKEYLRGPQHAGVLTTPSYLLRFPTQRARVAHFYETFVCKTFAPAPDATLPPADHACNRENNLAKRCGCNYCHATIEPVGAHWGRFGERNAAYLDPKVFPRYDARCRDCALAGNPGCDGQCANYIMQAYDGDGAGSLGLLKTYLYRSGDDEPNIEGGPKMLVDKLMQTGDVQRCAAKRVWNEFLGRPMSGEEETLYLPQLVKAFTQSGFKLKTLIEQVLMTDAYRRID